MTHDRPTTVWDVTEVRDYVQGAEEERTALARALEPLARIEPSDDADLLSYEHRMPLAERKERMLVRVNPRDILRAREVLGAFRGRAVAPRGARGAPVTRAIVVTLYRDSPVEGAGEIELYAECEVVGEYVPARLYPADLAHPAEQPEVHFVEAWDTLGEGVTLTDAEQRTAEDDAWKRLPDVLADEADGPEWEPDDRD